MTDDPSEMDTKADGLLMADFNNNPLPDGNLQPTFKRNDYVVNSEVSKEGTINYRD
jgi:hypothetical protein